MDMQPSIWHTQDVASAVALCRQRMSILVVLVEPAPSILSPPRGGADSEPLARTFARSATAALHRVTFAAPAVREALAAAGAVCLRLHDDDEQQQQPSSSLDFANFCAVFDVPPSRPALFFIGPTGRVHALELGFVGPRTFGERLAFAQRVVREPALGDSAAAAAAALLAAAVTSRADGSNDAAADCSAAQCSIANRAACAEVSSHQEQASSAEASLNMRRVTTGTNHGFRHQVEQGAADSEASNIVAAAREEGARAACPARSAAGPRGRDFPTSPAGDGSARQPTSNPTSAAVSIKLPSDIDRNARANIAVRLAEGSVLRRSFGASDRFSLVRAWVADEGKLVSSDFALSTSFPKRFFDLGEDAKMLSELQLCPSASLFVTVTAEQRSTTTVPGLSTASSLVTSTLGMVGSAAARVASWLPTLSGDGTTPANAGTEPRHNAGPESARNRSNPTSMAEVRRRESESRERNQYYNGNGTQFNGDDDDPSDIGR